MKVLTASVIVVSLITAILYLNSAYNEQQLHPEDVLSSDIDALSSAHDDVSLSRHTMDIMQWMETTGYADFQRMNIENSPEEAADVQSGLMDDFAAIPTDVAAEDAHANLLAGLAEIEPSRAILYLTNALTHGNYIVAAHQIALQYELMIVQSLGEESDLAPIALAEKQVLSEDEVNYLTWLAVGVELNDPMSKIIVEVTNLEEKVRSAAIQSRSMDELEKIDETRQAMQLEPIRTGNLENAKVMEYFLAHYMSNGQEA